METGLDFIHWSVFFNLLYMLGLSLGLGATVLTGVMFLTSISDKIITRSELRFIKLGSYIIWLALLLVVLGSSLLTGTYWQYYVESDNFLAVITIIVIILINGLFFQLKHLPLLKNNLDLYLPDQPIFRKKSIGLYTGQVIFIVSWLFMLILEILSVDLYTYGSLMTIYGMAVFLSWIIAMISLRSFLRSRPHLQV
ncbi:MAG: hypothetical protein ACOCU8_01025 [Patescibacteria group bacterium]